MRIAYVTAHYPPDFPSGATLQVERLAGAASVLGHEVEVFAGAINAGLADGECRTVPGTGAGSPAVHWIGTAERIEQGDDANWDNPLAERAAVEWLAVFRPDVIHMHTLQTLGVGVVEAALASGARTVVTMHDMWWWCPRLFLVDTGLQPCSLVTDVGSCRCARTAAWRAHRAERLQTVLDRVDRVLVPSSSLRDVVVANGLDPARVSVDENDVAVRPGHAPPKVWRHDDVRFLYMGGANALKGAGVLLEAARALAGVGGWNLRAVGLSPGPGLPDAVRPEPAFAPHELASVLDDADVLVIPSIARESYSLAAREALAAGLAVITSDCVGPEEVVHDGRNGLVVPTGDPTALAAAMRSLVDDRALLHRLHVGAGAEPVTVRSAADHMAGLIGVYSSAPSRPANTDIGRVAFVVGADGANARYRVHHPREALGLHDVITAVGHYLDPDLHLTTGVADVVVLQRVPATARLLELVDGWRAAGTLVLFDTDDLVFDPALVAEIPSLSARPAAEQALYLDGVRRYRMTLEACDGAVVSTAAIADHVRTTTGQPVAVVPNGLGLVELLLAERALRARRQRPDGPVRLAYLSGSDSHQDDLAMIAGALATVLGTHPDVELLLVGPISPGPELAGFAGRIDHRPLQPWRTLPALLAGVDVNLAPLVRPSRFNEAKSAIKWLEAAAVATPTVASPTAPFTEAIEHGVTGLLCGSPDDWVPALTGLIGDHGARARMGAAARRRAELQHGPHLTARSYLAALAELRAVCPPGAGRSTSAGDGPAGAPDERAPSAPALDLYDVGDRRRWIDRLRRR